MQCVFFPTIANLGQIWKAISLSDQIGRLADFEKKEEVNQMDRTKKRPEIRRPKEKEKFSLGQKKKMFQRPGLNKSEIHKHHCN